MPPHIAPGPAALPDADLDTLATALYVRIDDWLKTEPRWAPWRPAAGITPELNDAEALTLAVLQALLGYVSEARWLAAFAAGREQGKKVRYHSTQNNMFGPA
jgi:hypothetical protein